MFVWSKEQAMVLLQDNLAKSKIGGSITSGERVADSSPSDHFSIHQQDVVIDIHECEAVGNIDADEGTEKEDIQAEERISKNKEDFSSIQSDNDKDTFEDAFDFLPVEASASSYYRNSGHIKVSGSVSDSHLASSFDKEPAVKTPQDGSDHSWSQSSESALPWWSGKIVLDLGAGDGHVTQILADSAKDVYVTETSPVMRKRLKGRGYNVLDAYTWATNSLEISFDLITCLNVLDRCDTPVTLLKDIYARLSEGGKLVVALVLPIFPYVETGTVDHEPLEALGITGHTIEEQVNSLIEEVFPRLGFDVAHWTRLPYLCEGDLDQAFYWLSDIVLVLTKRSEVTLRQL